MERVEVQGRDAVTGEVKIIGTVNLPPNMYAKQLLTDWFGSFEIGDDSEADCMYQMIQQVVEYAHEYTPEFEAVTNV